MLSTESGSVEKAARIIFFSIVAIYTLDKIELGFADQLLRWLGFAGGFSISIAFSGIPIVLCWLSALFLSPGLVVLIVLVGFKLFAEK